MDESRIIHCESLRDYPCFRSISFDTLHMGPGDQEFSDHCFEGRFRLSPLSLPPEITWGSPGTCL